MFEFFDHTADLGIRARASSPDNLFAEAARGLFAAAVERPDAIRTTDRLDLTIPGRALDDLMFDWLRELLYRHDAERMVYATFEVTIREAGLTATAFGEPFDPARHGVGREVKAVTYHGLRVERQPDGRWLAEIIVDI